jgi:hypothetical protein
MTVDRLSWLRGPRGPVLALVILVAAGVVFVRKGASQPNMLALIASAPTGASGAASEDEIDYLGESIPLSKVYDDYDDYKDDPDNLPPESVARVEKLLTGAKLAESYKSRAELVHAVTELQFPGYGLMQLGERPMPDGSRLAAYAIEIPKAGKERFVVYRGRGDEYVLEDDFIESEDRGIGQVRDGDGDQVGELVYSTFQGVTVLTRRPR